MKIAELFVKLGFQTTGAAAFDDALNKLGIGEIKAFNLKRGLQAAGLAFTGLMYFAAKAGTDLFKFHQMTGMSTDSLQRWEYAAAKANVAAGTVRQTIEGLQEAQAEIALGQGNNAPWALLGIDSHQDPFEVLRQIHERVKESAGMAPAMARLITAQMGIGDDMFQFLRRDGIALDDLNSKYKLSLEQARHIDEMNARWSQMKFRIEQAGISLGEKFGEPLLRLLARAEPTLDKVADYLNRMSASTPEGDKLRQRFETDAKYASGFLLVLFGINTALRTMATLAAVGSLFGLGGAAAGGAAAAGGTAAAATGGGLGATLAAGAESLFFNPLTWLAGLAVGGPLFAQHRNRARSGGDANYLHIVRDDFKHVMDGIRRRHSEDKDFWMPSWVHRTPQGPAERAVGMLGRPIDWFRDLKPMDFTGSRMGGGTTITIHQTINGVHDPVAAGREAAKQIQQVLNKSQASTVDQSAVGAYAY